MSKQANLKKKLKAAIYCRISTQEQAITANDRSSTDSQEDICRKWLEVKGYKLYKVYTDTKSGRNIERPQLQKLLSECSHFDIVVSTRLDRISRSIKDFQNLIEILDEKGVAINFANEEIDTSTLMGKAMRNILMVFAEFESDMVSKRTREQRIAAEKEGFWMGGYVPLGYDREDGMLTKNDEEAVLVNYIFDLYVKFKSAEKVRDLINNEGFRNKEWTTLEGNERGGNIFTPDAIRRILKRRFYTGYNELDGELYKTRFPPLVSASKFSKAQEITENNRRNPKEYVVGKAPNLLQGIINCGFCESAMTNSHTNKSGTRYYYYKCSSKNKGIKLNDHNPKDLPYKTVDEFTICTLKAFLAEPEMMQAFMTRSEHDTGERIAQTKELIKQIRSNRLQLIRSKDNVTQNLMKDRNPALTKHWEEELEGLLNQISEIDSVIKEKEEELTSLENAKQLSGDQYHRILTEFHQIIYDEPQSTKQNLMRTLIRKVESKVEKVKTGNKGIGELRIDYVCDHHLISEWEDIKEGLKKNANSEKGIKVRTSLALGSPGWIRTNDRSVNSRLLCH
jgi:site-specific DNA recombinase